MTTEQAQDIQQEQQPEAVEAAQEAPQEAESAEGEQPEEAKADEPKKESRQYTQEEVDALVNKVRRNARYLARKETEADLYARLATEQRAPQRQPENVSTSLDRPNRSGFTSDEAYLEALAEFKAKEQITAFQQRAVMNEEQERESKALGEFKARTESARTKYSDFDEVVAMSDAPLTDVMKQAIVTSNVGPDLTYHLAKNPLEAERIARLPAVLAVREIAKLEMRLEAPAKPTLKATSAPTPPTPVSGRGSSHPDPNRMSMSEYAAWRASQRVKAR